MGPKRTGQDESWDRNGPPDPTPVIATTMRAADSGDSHLPKKGEEHYSLFWRVFGGTILSIVALVGVTIYNNLSSSLAELRSEVSRANEARADLIRKDEFNSRLSNNWDRVQTIQQQYNAANTTLTSIRTELEGIKDRTARQAIDLDAMKKDQSGTTDALKKDVATLDALKEKLATLAADLKMTREDLQKLTTSVDRNQAYDLERKAHRDGQYKQIDETLKEFQRGLQDCREKLARFEGQYAPVGFTGPPTPTPKKSTPKTAPAKLPIDLKPTVELAPPPRTPK